MVITIVRAATRHALEALPAAALRLRSWLCLAPWRLPAAELRRRLRQQLRSLRPARAAVPGDTAGCPTTLDATALDTLIRLIADYDKIDATTI